MGLESLVFHSILLSLTKIFLKKSQLSLDLNVVLLDGFSFKNTGIILCLNKNFILTFCHLYLLSFIVILPNIFLFHRWRSWLCPWDICFSFIQRIPIMSPSKSWCDLYYLYSQESSAWKNNEVHKILPLWTAMALCCFSFQTLQHYNTNSSAK